MSDYFAALHSTWPAAKLWHVQGFDLRDGAGAGKRATAASLSGPFSAEGVTAAEADMRARGMKALFMVRDGQDDLDGELEQRGYRTLDPTSIFAAPISALTDQRPPPVSSFVIWPPLAIVEDIWAECGTDRARQALMHRTPDPKAAILGRTDDAPAGAAFAAIHQNICMVHALDVIETLRRKGTATNMMRRAAIWAQDLGADEIAVAVTDTNAGAHALYSALGLTVVGHYHYRVAPS